MRVESHGNPARTGRTHHLVVPRQTFDAHRAHVVQHIFLETPKANAIFLGDKIVMHVTDDEGRKIDAHESGPVMYIEDGPRLGVAEGYTLLSWHYSRSTIQTPVKAVGPDGKDLDPKKVPK